MSDKKTCQTCYQKVLTAINYSARDSYKNVTHFSNRNFKRKKKYPCGEDAHNKYKLSPKPEEVNCINCLIAVINKNTHSVSKLQRVKDRLKELTNL